MAEIASLDPTTMSNCTGEAGEPATRCNQEFSHRIKLVPVDGASVSLRGIPWSVHFEEEKYNRQGMTDAEGKTERIKTSQPKKLFALVGKLGISETWGQLWFIKGDRREKDILGNGT